MSNVFVNEYGHELVTIQLTLSADDVEALRIAGEWGDDPDLVGICQHIVEQYNAVKSQGE